MESRRRSRFTDAEIDEYAAAHSAGPDEVQRELQAITAERTGAASRGCRSVTTRPCSWRSLVRAMGARRAVEVGTFTGYSALAVARGLGPEGRLLCCDVSEEWTAIGREAWERAGVADRIDLRIGPGIDTLRALPDGGAVRLRVHRRRQARLPGLLRGDPAAAASGRSHPHRQRAPGRACHRRVDRPTRASSRSASSTTRS